MLERRDDGSPGGSLLKADEILCKLSLNTLKCVVSRHTGRAFGANEGRTQRPIYQSAICSHLEQVTVAASGSEVSLGPKAFSLLLLFVQNAGGLIDPE